MPTEQPEHLGWLSIDMNKSLFLGVFFIGTSAFAAPIITPSSTSVFLGGTVQFSTVSGNSVNWSLHAGSTGTISATGLYTAPATGTFQAKHVLDGCPVLPNDHIFNTKITNLPVDANSATRIAAILGGTSSYIQIEPDFRHNVMFNTTPTTTTVSLNTANNDGTYSMLPAPYTGVENNLYPANYFAQDRHILGVNTNTCQFSEFYNFYPIGTNGSCPTCNTQGNIKYDAMTYSLPNTQNGTYGGGVDAAGMFLQPLAFTYSELKAGIIKHALRFTLANGYIQSAFIWPAVSNATPGCTPTSQCVPYGARFRLKASFPITSYSPTTQIILQALKDYGMILADGGTSMHIQSNSDVFQDTNTYTAIQSEIRFGNIVSQWGFDIVDESSLEVSSTTGKVNLSNPYVTPDNFAEVVATDTVNGSTTSVRVAIQAPTVGTYNPAFQANGPTIAAMSGTPQFQIPVIVNGNNTQTATCSMSPTIGSITSGCAYTAPAGGVKSASTTIVTMTATADSTATINFPLTIFSSDAIRVNSGGFSNNITTPAWDSANDYGPDYQGKIWATDPTGIGFMNSGKQDSSYSTTLWVSSNTDPDIGLFYNQWLGIGDGAFAAMVPNGTYRLLMGFAAGDPGNNSIAGVNESIDTQGPTVLSTGTYRIVTGTINYVSTSTTIPVSVTNNQFYFALRSVDYSSDTLINKWSLTPASDFTSTANFSTGLTPTAVAISYTVPARDAGSVCTWEFSQNNTYTPLVHDVDTTLFSGANQDNRAGTLGAGTQSRTFVVGQAGIGITYAPVASDGKRYSRALLANTTHYGRITCGSDTATLSFNTANVIPGDTYPGTFWPVDPSSSVVAWPTIDPNNVNTCYVHPVTGLCWQPFLRPDFEQAGTSDDNFNHIYDYSVLGGTSTCTVSGWTNPCNLKTSDNALAVTSSTNSVILTTDHWDINLPGNGSDLAGITAEIQGFVDNSCSAGDDRVVQVAITRDGLTPWTPFLSITLPTQTAYIAASSPTTNGGDDPATPVPYMQTWFSGSQLLQPETGRTAMLLHINDLNPRFGNYNRTGQNLLISYPGSAGNGAQWEAFSTNWSSGSHIILDTGVTPFETTVSSITSATQITVSSGTGTTTNAQYIAPNFGFIVHKKTTNCSMSLDYVHYQKTYNSTPLLNGGSGSSRQTPLTKFPEGETVTGATNASPIVLTFNSGATAHRFAVGNVIHCAQILGNTAANGNFTIGSSTTFTATLTGTTGNGVFSGNGYCYTTTPPARKGYFYQMSNEGNAPQLLWINTDQVPAEIRYLGLARTIVAGFPSGSNNSFHADNYSLDDSTPDSPGVYLTMEDSSNKEHMMNGNYIGNPQLGYMREVGSYANQNPMLGYTDAAWRWTDETPITTLTDQLGAFDVTYSTNIESDAVGLLNPTSVVLAGRVGPQNTACWNEVWDPTTKNVKGMVNSWTSPNWRWKGCHGSILLNGETVVGRAGYPLNSLGAQYGGPYTTALTDNGLNTVTETDCATLLSALSLGNPLNVTGTQCSQTVLSSTVPVTEGVPVGNTLGPIIVGDIADMWNSSDGDEGETIRVIGISGKTIVVQRAMWANHPIATHAIGSKFWWREIPPMTAFTGNNRGSFYGDTGWWDYTADPHGVNANDPYQQQLSSATIIQEEVFNIGSHTAGRGDHYITDSGPASNSGISYIDTCTIQSQGRFAGIRHGNYKATDLTCYNANPAFDGSSGGGVGAASMETHLSPKIETGTYKGNAFEDSRVYQIAEGWQETQSKVAGLNNWYLATNYNEFGNTYDYKRQKVNVWIGTHVGHDVSSWTYNIAAHDTNADNYNYCRALKANDCVSGSSANDLYANIPQYAATPANWYNGSASPFCLGFTATIAHDVNDLCVSLEPIQADELIQYGVDPAHSDPAGTGQRRLGIPFTPPKGLNGTNLNTNPLPDGSATVTTNWLVNLPPFVWNESGTNRTTWISTTVASGTPPGGTVNAYVRFGYNPSYFCSDRQEACIANANSIQTSTSVYSYEQSETPIGISCASGCNVVIPTLSQRIMWYQWVFKDGGGSTVGTGPATIMSTEQNTSSGGSGIINAVKTMLGKFIWFGGGKLQ